jgi:hypothetical protein
MQVGDFVFDVPDGLIASRLYVNGGVLPLQGLLDDAAFAALEAESVVARASARRNVLTESAAGGLFEERGGSPHRAFTAAPGSAAQWSIFSAPALVAAVEEQCGVSVTPTGGGTYSYYEQDGDHLGLHRDIAQCDLTLITCLDATRTAGFADGALLVYSRHLGLPLAEAARAGRGAATPMPIGRGDTIALLGGIVAHEVTAMPPGQRRIVSVMCYRVSIDRTPLS